MSKIVGTDKRHVHRVTCKNCAAKVEYVQREVQEYHGTDMSGGPDVRKWIVCPNCGKEITLEIW